MKAVITKVMSGDADAGIGYVTDVTPDVADQITLIPIPDDVNVIATYPIAVVNGSQEADLAQGFVDYVLGDGQQTLAEYGFLPLRRGGSRPASSSSRRSASPSSRCPCWVWCCGRPGPASARSSRARPRSRPCGCR